MVEGGLLLHVLVGGELVLLEPRQERLQQRFDLTRSFRHGGQDVACLSKRLGSRRLRLAPNQINPAGDFEQITEVNPHPRRWVLRSNREDKRKNWLKKICGGRGVKELAMNTSL